MRKSIRKMILGAAILASLGFGFFYFQNFRIIADNQDQLDGSVVLASTSPFKLPAGFSVSIFAKGLGTPRVMIFDNSGNMLVSLTGSGKVVVLPDKNRDGVADKVVTLLSGLNEPHGLALRCESDKSCKLYVAETNALAVYDYDEATLKATNRKKLLALPGGGNHITRTLLLTKQNADDVLLISIGSTCNVCHEKDARRATVISYNLRTGKSSAFATGLRNAVFMVQQPDTGKIWATEMGRDYLGDSLPPDEIDVLEQGKNYGWPNCFGKNIHDTVFDKNIYIRNPCMEPFETPSFIDLPAHSAPLGLAFVPRGGWPDGWAGSLLVAYHGSWNRSVPTGYKVVRLKFDQDGTYQGAEDFMTGFLSGRQKLGRPADILVLPGGVAYISDDLAGAVYRLRYKK